MWAPPPPPLSHYDENPPKQNRRQAIPSPQYTKIIRAVRIAVHDVMFDVYLWWEFYLSLKYKMGPFIHAIYTWSCLIMFDDFTLDFSMA